jgi:hypothetical protein
VRSKAADIGRPSYLGDRFSAILRANRNRGASVRRKELRFKITANYIGTKL